MPWSTSYLAEIDTVLTTVTGPAPIGMLLDATASALELGRERGATRFLDDYSSVTGGMSVVDLYLTADQVQRDHGERGFRHAVVLPGAEDAAASMHSWQISCANRGLLVRLFASLDEARAWLVRPGPVAR